MTNNVELPEVIFPILDSQRWMKTRQTAQNQIIKLYKKPNKDDFKDIDLSPYPWQLTAVVVFVLFVVLTVSFAWSGTKQYYATSLIVQSLIDKAVPISSAWLNFTISMPLFLGEIGALIFSLGSAIAGGDMWTLGRYTFRPISLIFRVSSIACALTAIIANVAITAIIPVNSIAGYEWYITFLAPIAVLMVGLYFEQLLLTSMRTRKEVNTQYEQAKKEYDQMTLNPESHEGFLGIWRECIWNELFRLKKQQDLLTPYAQLGNDYILAIVQAEINAHNFWNGDVEVSLQAQNENPLLSTDSSNPPLEIQAESVVD